MVVADDVGMAERREDGEFGVELLALLLGHLQVADFFPTDNCIVCLAADLANDAKGAMAWRKMSGQPSQRGKRAEMMWQPCHGVDEGIKHTNLFKHLVVGAAV